MTISSYQINPTGKSDRLRIGVVGLGRAFFLMLPTFLSDPRVHLVAAFDPREQARHQFATDFGAKTYADVTDLSDDPDIEVIYIASPHQFHAQQTEIAAAKGKHVLVEKPMALSIDDCDRMIAACRAAGVNLIVGHCHSFDTPYLQTRELIQSGHFGEIKMVHAVNFTDYIYRPRRPEELLTSEGGGAIFSQAAHQVDIVRLLVASPAIRVRACTGNWDMSRSTEGAYSALIWFNNGAHANLSYNGYGHFNTDEWMGWVGEMGERVNPITYGGARRRLSKIASREDEALLKAAGTYGGSAYKNPLIDNQNKQFYQHFGSIIVSCERADIRPLPASIAIYGDQQREIRPLAPPSVPRAEVIDELFDAVRSKQSPIHDGQWGKDTLQICLAILASNSNQADVYL